MFPLSLKFILPISGVPSWCPWRIGACFSCGASVQPGGRGEGRLLQGVANPPGPPHTRHQGGEGQVHLWCACRRFGHPHRAGWHGAGLHWMGWRTFAFGSAPSLPRRQFSESHLWTVRCMARCSSRPISSRQLDPLTQLCPQPCLNPWHANFLSDASWGHPSVRARGDGAWEEVLVSGWQLRLRTNRLGHNNPSCFTASALQPSSWPV